MIQLSVNLNKVALLRNSRGAANPGPLFAAETCIAAGAAGITLHLRADRRHAREDDVRAIAQMMHVNLFRPVHIKTLTSQKRRALLTARKLLQEKAIAIENDIRVDHDHGRGVQGRGVRRDGSEAVPVGHVAALG